MRLGVALGSHQRDTFIGTRWSRDLVLTCTDDQSRNRRFGLLLAAGQNAGNRACGRSDKSSKVMQPPRRSTPSRGRANVEMPLLRRCLPRVVRTRTRAGRRPRPHDPPDQVGNRIAPCRGTPLLARGTRARGPKLPRHPISRGSRTVATAREILQRLTTTARHTSVARARHARESRYMSQQPVGVSPANLVDVLVMRPYH